jgi:hypothetical protein
VTELDNAASVHGNVVVNLRYNTVRAMLEHSGQTYGNFWQDLFSKAIVNRDPIALKRRMQVDAELFGQHALQIRCALLSFDGCGATFYGDYAVTLSLDRIAERLSLLEDNPFNVELSEIPNLNRATWGDRAMLAVVKWAEPASADRTTPILELIEVRGASRDGQSFVEVHIWGTFTVESFAAIAITVPRVPDKLAEADILRIEDLARARRIPTRRVVNP